MRAFAQKPKATQQTTSAKSRIPGRSHFGQGGEGNPILHLQRLIGNQAVQRLLEANTKDVKGDSTAEIARFDHDFSWIPVYSKASMAIQPKLTISTPGDYGEREADRVAEEVMRMPDGPSFQTPDSPEGMANPPALQRACNCASQSKSDEDETLHRWALPSISRLEDSVVTRVIDMRNLVDSIPEEEITNAVEETDEEAAPPSAIERKTAGVGATLTQLTATQRLPKALNAACQSGGQPLPPQTRRFMEPRFGHDFSTVRIHNDHAAGDLAQQIQARAFTTGNRIFFAPGEFQPDRTSGKHLLAHELAHVVQQGKGSSGVDRQVQRTGIGGLNCPPYASYDTSAGLKTYNCSGLAHRTYDFKGITPTKAFLSKATSVACGTPCDHVGMVKHWLWEYDVHYQDSTGTVAQNPPTDFHTVGGPTAGDPMAKDSDEFFTKNGKRNVYGPGTAPSFKPPAKEQATLSDPSEAPQFDATGQPIYKLRSNFKESCYCLPCPKATKAP